MKFNSSFTLKNDGKGRRLPFLLGFGNFSGARFDLFGGAIFDLQGLGRSADQPNESS